MTIIIMLIKKLLLIFSCIIILSQNVFALAAFEPSIEYEKNDMQRNYQYLWIFGKDYIKCHNEADPRYPTMYIGLHYIPDTASHSGGWYFFDYNTGKAKTRLITLPNKKTYYGCDVYSKNYGKLITGWNLVDVYWCYFDRDDYSLRCCLTQYEYEKFILEHGKEATPPEIEETKTRIILPEPEVNKLKYWATFLPVELLENMADEPYALSEEMPPDKN